MVGPPEKFGGFGSTTGGPMHCAGSGFGFFPHSIATYKNI